MRGCTWAGGDPGGVRAGALAGEQSGALLEGGGCGGGEGEGEEEEEDVGGGEHGGTSVVGRV